MLRITIHVGPLETTNPFNRVARLDIVYQKLSPVADYKLILIERNSDVPAPRVLRNYPRWSASLWDLTARALAICLPDLPPATEVVPEVEPGGKRCAFARELSAIIEHTSGNVKNTLGTVSIKQAGRKRGIYQASFDEHAMKSCQTETFEFAPAYFRSAELLLHACLHHLQGKPELSPRPGLCLPPSVTVAGLSYIQVHQLVEPARTGFQTWLNCFSEPPAEYPGAPLGIAPETMYAKFLHTAI